tara:strand:- start:2654 stop:2782 length:129 start_codon:yes stop_codon:yes gene_type:complete
MPLMMNPKLFSSIIFTLSIITQTPETLMDNVIGWGGRDRTCE